MAKFDIYETITARMIEQLESGVIPWRKPWHGGYDKAVSASTGKPYSLLNQFLLGKPGKYYTFKQAKEAGGMVRKGEKAHMVVFWKQIKVQDEKDPDSEKLVPYLTYYNVFHASQIDGLPEEAAEVVANIPDPIAAAEACAANYIKRSGIKFENQLQDRAYYSPAKDCVVVPTLEQFDSAAEYYNTVFHELTHSTGHESRLDRLHKAAAFGSEEYSKEELVAEIGAASCLNQLQIETPASFENSAAYVQNWLKALKDDKKLIVSAAGKAEKAVDMIMDGFEPVPEPEPEPEPEKQPEPETLPEVFETSFNIARIDAEKNKSVEKVSGYVDSTNGIGYRQSAPNQWDAYDIASGLYFATAATLIGCRREAAERLSSVLSARREEEAYKTLCAEFAALQKPAAKLENPEKQPEVAAESEAEVHPKYYPVSEELARRAKEANSYSDYKPGSATAEYQQAVDEAFAIAERQKQKTDSMHHEKIDSLVDRYAQRLAAWYNEYHRNEASCESILIAGPANFPMRKKEKQNQRRDTLWAEYKEIQGIVDRIKAVGTGGISSDDPDALQKLAAKLEKLEKLQETMKAANAAIRLKDTAKGDSRLAELGYSAKEIAELREPDWCGRVGFPDYELKNNSAEIRRIRERIDALKKSAETEYPEREFVECSMVANKEENRLQLIFHDKPDEETRAALKSNGFRWSPRAGAWQRQLNANAIWAVDHLVSAGVITEEKAGAAE